MKKYIYFVLIPLLLWSCDYAPIYSNKNDYNFSIEKINFEGNSEINNLVQKRLIKFQNRNDEKKFIITTTSSYEKISQSKNLSGKTTNYLILVEIIFKIENENEQKTLINKEEFLIKNFSDKFEENKLEKTKKESLVNSIVNEFIIQLSRI
tara:strand:- start:660 stop:1112 length:453 start_codon:yes stop_codon:yes gene_type:complete